MKTPPHVTKHIFITGGVVSSLGKGITAASLGHLLARRGYRPHAKRTGISRGCRPMSPFRHGEVCDRRRGGNGLTSALRADCRGSPARSQQLHHRPFTAPSSPPRAAGRYLRRAVVVARHDEIKGGDRIDGQRTLDVASRNQGTAGYRVPAVPGNHSEAYQPSRQNVFIHLTSCRSSRRRRVVPSNPAVGGILIPSHLRYPRVPR